MAIPANWSTVILTGQFLTIDGEAMEGTVRFSSTVRLVDAAEAVIVPASLVTETLDETGSFSVELPATDDPQIAPSFYYEVYERLIHPDLPATTGAERTARQRNAKYLIQLPAADPTVDLADLTPLADPGDALSPLATRSYVDAADALLLPKAGGAITGDLDVAGRLRYAGFRVPPMVPAPRNPAFRAATTSFLMQTGHGWTAGGGGTASSDLNSTTQFVRGTQALRVTTNSTGVQSHLRRVALPVLDLTGKMIRLTLRVDDITNLDHLNFYVGTSSFANFFQWTFHTHSGSSANYVQSGEWVVIQLQWADITNVGGTFTITNGVPSTKTGFTDLQFAAYDNAAGAITWHLQSVEIVPDLTSTFPSGVISVTFDDSWKSQYNLARPKMDALGYRGSLYTIADYIGTANRLTLTDLRSLQNFSGWEVAGHAYANANHGQPNGFADLTAEDVNRDFLKLKLWMTENGFTSDNFAYPKGHFDKTTDGVPVDQIAAQYWATSRTIISETKEAFPPAMPQRIKALTGISDAVGAFWTPTKLAEAGGVLDRCNSQGDWLILTLHELTTGVPADTTVITQSGFESIVDSIAARGIPVLPVNDIIRHYS